MHEPELSPGPPTAVEPPPASPAPPVPLTLRDALVAALFALAAVAVVLAGMRSVLFDLDRHSVPKELVLHATTLLTLLLVLPGWRMVRADATQKWLGAFVLWSGLSALLATNHWLALRAFGLTFSGFVLFSAARRFAGRSVAGWLLGAVAGAVTLGAAIGAAQAYGLDFDWLAAERIPGGTFGNRNFLAHVIAIGTPGVIYAATHARARGTRRFWLVALAVCMQALVLTRSRAGWLGFAAALAVLALGLLFARRDPERHRRLPLRGVLVALGVGALFAMLLPNRLEWRSDSPYADTLARITDYRSGSGRGRLIQYGNSLQLVARNPVFGTGPGNWFVEYPLVTTRGDPSFHVQDPIPTNPWPSSDWVALVAERGVIGLVLVLLSGFALLTNALRRLRSEEADAPWRAATLLATLAAVTVTGAFDAVLLNATPLFLAALLAGMLVPAGRTVVDRPLDGRARRGALLLTVLFVLLPGVHAALQLNAIRIAGTSDTRATYERALRLDPGNHRLHLILARNGRCSQRLPHARAAARLLPHHPAPARALAACGARDPD